MVISRAVSHSNSPLPQVSWWTAGSLILCALVLVPVVTIAVLALFPTENIWPHLMATVLPGYVWQTLALMAGVGLITLVTGTATAWLITMCKFPGRKVLQWLLLVPLAMPTYIVAYTYVDMLEYAGPVQSLLRDVFGWSAKADYWFPEIRTLSGGIFVLSLVLYPYVFITARATFAKQSVCHLEVARTLGRTAWGTFFSVALPQARPALAVGVSLAMMECLNDIGAVEHFGINTLTLGIYSTWIERGNLGGAAQIAFVMFVFVIALLFVERRGRRNQAFYQTSKRAQPVTRRPLTGWRAAAAVVVCTVPFVLGFLLPGGVLLSFAIAHFEQAANAEYFQAIANTLLLALAATVLAIAAGLFLAYASRLAKSRLVAPAVRLASAGYAIPGTVLGIGILIPLTALDNAVSDFFSRTTGLTTGLMLTGTIAAVSYAYVVRFLAISHGNIDAGLQRITPGLDAAARTLGRNALQTLREVHLPLLRPALISAALLVFVDCMKELPATLLLRPFDFEVLSTMVYTLASLDQLEESALAALTIVAAGIIPVIALSRSLRA